MGGIGFAQDMIVFGAGSVKGFEIWWSNALRGKSWENRMVGGSAED